LAIGIVGVGRIGSRVERWARSQGMTVLQNDPPRQAAGEQGFVSLDEIARVCDIVTFHPTLSLSGPFRSYHLLDSAFLAKINRRALLINASRGAVADNNALYDAIVGNSLLDVALDVWENEPKISQELLDRAFIATPHIAGYSAKGKLNASLMMLQSFAQYTSYKAELPHIELPPPANNNIEASTLADALLKIYSPLSDTAKLKSSPSMFEWLRNNYELRREPSEFIVHVDGKPVVL
ncbi:MAG: erythronate-4-phosphate dehydrogenase, partial [Bacteroidaceae bacterium]|nr:erythronate-4-phosphate dehydrogenase [Bacteroidaceae bacterium]